MARTTINSLGVPAGTITAADLTFPLTDFSSTGIDDNATSTAIIIDSSNNVGIAGDLYVDTNILVVDATNNRVGIGEVSPATTLDIKSSSGLIRNRSTSGSAIIRNESSTGNYTLFETDNNGQLDIKRNTTTHLTIDSSGNIAVTGTVDGRDLAADGTKLDGITASATANPNALDNIVEDTTPQLGGNLDFNGNIATSFTSTGIDDNATTNMLTLSNSTSAFGNLVTGGAFLISGTAYGLTAGGNLTSTGIDDNASSTSLTIDSSGNISVTGTVDGRDLATDGTKLDGIESGATADQTASEILTAIKTVDGSGSGLDADTLDGQQGTYYAPASTALTTSTSFGGDVSGTYNAIAVTDDSHNHTTFAVSGITDLNSISGTSVTSFRPFVSNFQASNRSGSNYNGGFDVGLRATGYRSQFVFEANGVTTPPKFRNLVNGTWGGWYALWHTGNDGSGSGLDADTLDGQQGSYYQPASTAITTANIGSQSVSSASNIDGIGFTNTGSNSGTNADTIDSNGISYYTAGVTNFSGNATDGALFSQRYSSSWQHQIAGDYRSGQIALRGKNNGTWQSWRKVWDTGNDGSGSGLDADTVDGIQGASFLRSDTSDSITAGTTYTFGTSNAEGLRFTNSSYSKSLYIGGWSSANSSGISRIRNSNDNLHMDAGSVGHMYLNHYCTGNVYIRTQLAWHAGNDGSGSGLDADNLDGYTWGSGGKPLFVSAGNSATFTSANDTTVSIRSSSTSTAASMSFHRPAAYAVNFGLDSDNHLKMGGWSIGNATPHVWQNSGNYLATGNITAYSSDKRLKTNIVNIPNALNKVMSLNGVTFDWKEQVQDLGFKPDRMHNEVGVLAQEIEAVLPQATAPAPFDLENDNGQTVSKSGENYLTVQYEKIVPLLIEAIKEQQAQIKEQQAQIEELKEIIKCQ